MRNSMLLDNGKLEHIWYTLRQHNGNANAEDQMNYEDFCQASLSSYWARDLASSFAVFLAPQRLGLQES